MVFLFGAMTISCARGNDEMVRDVFFSTGEDIPPAVFEMVVEEARPVYRIPAGAVAIKEVLVDGKAIKLQKKIREIYHNSFSAEEILNVGDVYIYGIDLYSDPDTGGWNILVENNPWSVKMDGYRIDKNFKKLTVRFTLRFPDGRYEEGKVANFSRKD
jgi:hypothetical protein